MADPTSLPDLPLMHAGVPRPFVELLRAAGLPIAALPRMTLLAGGSGRFVLFDSRVPSSAAQARRASRQGLTALDLKELCDGLEEVDPRGPGQSLPAGTAREFVARLKTALEKRGGVWLRLADYPFPYQSAFGVAIEHLSEELDDFSQIAQTLAGLGTHFVSSRLRPERLGTLAQSGNVDLGWQIRGDDCQMTRRGTLSHWATRLQRFRTARLNPRGIVVAEPGLAIPGWGSLLHQGLEYSCHLDPESPCRTEHPAGGGIGAVWVHLGMSPLPTRDESVEWIGEHYQSGIPLFVLASTARLDLVQEVVQLAGDAARCSLMWRATLGEFVDWWKRREQARLQVWRRPEGYEIHVTGPVGGLPWSIEVWRGPHLATVPLAPSEMFLPDDGLVYLQGQSKSPGGFVVSGAAKENWQRSPAVGLQTV
ncbi:MAG: hypothetical protein ACKV0T_11380 [Planctomycetales bacterium]